MLISATRCPDVVRQPRPRLASGKHKAAVLLSEPSGDFPAGMAVSRPEIAYGVLLGAWPPGTRFRLDGRTHTVGADGWVHDDGGQIVIVYLGAGR